MGAREQGAGAQVDSHDPDYTDWYQRRDEDGRPVEYDYETGTYLDEQGEPVESPEEATSVPEPVRD